MQLATVEKGYQKYAWVLLFIFGIFAIIDAIAIIAGVDPDPSLFQKLLGQSLGDYSSLHPEAGTTITYLLQLYGSALLVVGVFTTVVSYLPYRKGEKWAWYTMWYLPVWGLLEAISSYTNGGGSWVTETAFLLVGLAALLLPYRKFFPRK